MRTISLVLFCSQMIYAPFALAQQPQTEPSVRNPEYWRSPNQTETTQQPTDQENVALDVDDTYLTDAPPTSAQELSLNVDPIDLIDRAPPPQESQQRKKLVVVSWHLDDAIAGGFAHREKYEKKVWRNTFGSERHTQPQTRRNIHDLDADIVLLQGVRSLLEVRKLFHARDWKVIYSRQLLPTLDKVHMGRRRSLSDQPTTAIAVRYQRGVRITGVRHFKEFAEEADHSSESDNAPDILDTVSFEDSSVEGDKDPENAKTVPPDRPSTSGVAVRIFNRGQVRWFAAASFSKRCRDQAEKCPGLNAMANWIKTSDTTKMPIVVGGQLPTADDESQNTSQRWTWLSGETSVCADQNIKSSPNVTNTQPQYSDEIGCLLSTELGD